LSEHAAYGRIEAARAARKFPVLLERLAEGALTLTNLCLLAPHLTPDNHLEVLAAARHKTKREVELLVATLRPQPPEPATVRKLPSPRPAIAAPTRSAWATWRRDHVRYKEQARGRRRLSDGSQNVLRVHDFGNGSTSRDGITSVSGQANPRLLMPS
jgi:hypothetical protein